MSSQPPLLAFNTPQKSNDLSQQAFSVIFIAIVLSSILIVLYTNVINNIFFQTFNLNQNSTYHAIIVALFVTALFAIVLYLINSYNLFAQQSPDLAATGLSFPPGQNLLGQNASVPVITKTLNNKKLIKNNKNNRNIKNNKR